MKKGSPSVYMMGQSWSVSSLGFESEWKQKSTSEKRSNASYSRRINIGFGVLIGKTDPNPIARHEEKAGDFHDAAEVSLHNP